REALAAGVSASRRALVHREAAHALAARSRPDPLDVAYHARLGGEHELAARALVEAAHAAGDRFDPLEAERLLDQALDLPDDPAIRSSCLSLGGRARFVAGDLHGAEERLEEALRLAQGSALLVPSVWLGNLRVHQDRPEEALDLTEAATQPGLGAPNPFATMVGFIARGHALAQVGRFREALATFDALD